MCDISLFLKHTLPVATRYEGWSWQYFDIAKHNRSKNKPLTITTQTQLQQKRVFT